MGWNKKSEIGQWVLLSGVPVFIAVVAVVLVVNTTTGGKTYAEESVVKRSDVARKLYEAGKEYLSAKEYGKAIDAFEQILREYPKSDYSESGEVNHLLATCYRRIGEDEKAIESYRECKENCSDVKLRQDSHYGMIQLYRRMIYKEPILVREAALKGWPLCIEYLKEYPNSNRTKHVRKVEKSLGLIYAWLVHEGEASVLVAGNVSEPNEGKIIRVGDTMHLLRQKYPKLMASALKLLEINAEAIAENPDLAYVEAGVNRLEEVDRKGVTGDKEFRKYRYNSDDKDAVNKLAMRCRRAFGPLAWVNAINDPNREPELRPILMFSYSRILDSPEVGGSEGFMKTLEQQGLMVFDPNDPNKARLWKNLKQHLSEMAEHWESERKAIIKEDIPEFFITFSGEYDVHDASKEMYFSWLVIFVPDELVEAVRQFGDVEEDMDDIRGWRPLAGVGIETDQEHKILKKAFELEKILKRVLSVRRAK